MAKLYIGDSQGAPAIVKVEEVTKKRYNLTVDNYFPPVNANGETEYLNQSSIPSLISFDGIKSIKRGTLRGALAYKGVEYMDVDVVFPDLEIIDCTEGLDAFCKESHFNKISFPKLTTVSAPNVFEGMAENATIDSFEFPALKTVEGVYSLNSMFSLSRVKNVNFLALESIKGTSCAQNMFHYTSKLQTISFPCLTEVVGNSVLNEAFSDSSLVNISFPALTVISGNRAWDSTFSGCALLETVLLPSLMKILGDAVFNCTFEYCSSLKSISFPSLTEIEGTSVFGNGTYYYAFRSCTALTEIHFRADMQSTIEAIPGYSAKWGATKATIYFDL